MLKIKCFIVGLGNIAIGYDQSIKNKNIFYTHAKSISHGKIFDLIGGSDISKKKRDVFFGITTSGKSKNLLEAFKTCKRKGIKTICLTKKNYPKNLDKLCSIVIPVTAERVDRIQEIKLVDGTHKRIVVVNHRPPRHVLI